MSTARRGEAIIHFVMVGHTEPPDRGSVSTITLAEEPQVVARIILVAFVVTFIAARVLVLAEPGGATRHIWVDDQGRVLKVSLDARGITALRDEPPR